MCFPKAPKQDPEVAAQQAAQKQLELDRLAEEKDQQKLSLRRTLRGAGTRSLISGTSGSGFGTTYTQ